MEDREVTIRCSECKVPFIKLLPTNGSVKFLKLIDGIHKEVKMKIQGSVDTVICPKCGKVINVKKLIIES